MDRLQFAHFDVRPAMRQVWAHGAPVALGARAFDLLMLLVTHRDRVVGKEEIFEKVWPGLVVEDNNLSVQIHALRRALGSDAITTVTGRGYRFTALPASDAEAQATDTAPGNLPVRSETLYGREQDLESLLEACATPCCVTLCGFSGVGKTSLATLAAQQLAQRHRYAQGAWRVDLTDILDPALLAQSICEVVGFELKGHGTPLDECVAQLQHRELLMVLDNCEHVIDAAAEVVAALLSTAGRVTILATSQEPLRIPGERVLRLNPLAVPVTSQPDGAESYGAVRMLLERVRVAMGGRFEPTADELVDLVEVCRQLDGIPLALEFAASRVPLLGTAGVRSRLNDRLRLLVSGARSAPSRHRSLQAALEWSHQLLNPRTQAVLHRLALFPSGFSIEGARLMLQMEDDADVIEHLDVLVDRSLICAAPGSPPRYRLLETTRAFALECLRAEGGSADWQSRFAAVMAQVCLLAARRRDAAWMWREMPNLRAALSWAAGANDNAEAAVTIATYTSVVLGAGGAIREALENLQRVRCLVEGSDLPDALVARYWHWLGRLGVEGRLPTDACVQALLRADAMFIELGERRHRHACQRHLAEAALRAGQTTEAEARLESAKLLESADTPSADLMRRWRVEALLAQARGDFAAALRHTQAALSLAELDQVDRYRLLVMADMGWIHLQTGRPDAAVSSFQELLLHLDHSIRQGLARASALSGLTAAQVAAGRVADAERSAGRAVRALQQANLLRSRCDVLAWVLAASGKAQEAAQLLGAGEAFAAASGTERDPISLLARERAVELVVSELSPDDVAFWNSQGARLSESALLQLLEHAFTLQRHELSTESLT